MGFEAQLSARLTFDMSGGQKAKPFGRPLDGGVRRQLEGAHRDPSLAPALGAEAVADSERPVFPGVFSFDEAYNLDVETVTAARSNDMAKRPTRAQESLVPSFAENSVRSRKRSTLLTT